MKVIRLSVVPVGSEWAASADVQSDSTVASETYTAANPTEAAKGAVARAARVIMNDVLALVSVKVVAEVSLP